MITEMLKKPIIIAIDGPAAAGKGTLARHLATHFGLAYLDTGALYRAVGVLVLQSGGGPDDPAAATAAAQALNFDFHRVKGAFHAFINGIDIENDLRTQEAGVAASKVSAVPAVRTALKDFQVRFAEQSKTQGQGAVLDGRDIGTVICPDADIKIFLVADPMVRAERRHNELIAARKPSKGIQGLYEDLIERDKRDQSRTIAPLKPAEDALVLDTSHLDADAVFAQVLAYIKEKTGTM